MFADIWNFWAPRYEHLFVQRFVLGPTREFILSRVSEATAICDVGCGIGQLASELALRFPEARVLGIDPSPGMLIEAQRRIALPNLTFRLGSLEAIRSDERFDVVTCTNVLPYMLDQATAIRRMAEMLLPEGRLLTVQATADTCYDRVIHPFLKLAVSRARYLSSQEVVALMGAFVQVTVHPIGTARWIPSIAGVEGCRPRV